MNTGDVLGAIGIIGFFAWAVISGTRSSDPRERTASNLLLWIVLGAPVIFLVAGLVTTYALAPYLVTRRFDAMIAWFRIAATPYDPWAFLASAPPLDPLLRLLCLLGPGYACAMCIGALTTLRRDRAKPIRPISFLTDLPATTPAGVVGLLIDEQPNDRDITAAILDLGAKGYLDVEVLPRDHVFRRNDLYPPETEWMERALLARLFEKESETYEGRFVSAVHAGQRIEENRVVFLSSLQMRKGVWRRLGHVLEDEAVRRGLTTFAHRRYTRLDGIAGALLLPAMPLLFLYPYLAVGLALAACVVHVGSCWMPLLTEKGTDELGRWLAVRTYLADVIRMGDLPTAREIVARHLPLCVAFGLAPDLLRRFAAEGLEATTGLETAYLRFYTPGPGSPSRTDLIFSYPKRRPETLAQRGG